MTSVRWLAAAAAIAILHGCSGSWWPFGGAGNEQTARVPEGATEYSCAQGRRLLVRYAADGKAAWIIFPDREFRLDRAGSGERYTNGASTLVAREDAVTLDAEGGNQFTECRAAKR
jgi:membrane-bound inhibitor of C-type lysozyme